MRLCQELKELSHTDEQTNVQLAADQSWPWHSAGVATIRNTSLLPEDCPLAD
jgi:hypothetical protein